MRKLETISGEGFDQGAREGRKFQECRNGENRSPWRGRTVRNKLIGLEDKEFTVDLWASCFSWVWRAQPPEACRWWRGRARRRDHARGHPGYAGRGGNHGTLRRSFGCWVQMVVGCRALWTRWWPDITELEMLARGSSPLPQSALMLSPLPRTSSLSLPLSLSHTVGGCLPSLTI